jgi:hypothetical protein
MRLIRSLPAAGVLALALALLPAVATPTAHAAPKVKVGIADNKPDMFTDARFAELAIRYARVMVPYDAMHDYAQRTWLDGWMAGAKSDGVTPLVTFTRSYKRTSHNPSAAQMAASLRDVRKRYPWVKEFATWNEANINKQPHTVARWWLAMKRQCPSCTILGADLLDRSNVGTWAQRFIKAAHKAPVTWGLHNYVDANRLTTTGTKKLLKAVKGNVWFTETGGVVKRNNGSTVAFPASASRAATVTRFVFDKLAKLSPRVQRVYLYHWNTGVGAEQDSHTWDSGLIGPDDQPRPALGVLQAILGKPVVKLG